MIPITMNGRLSSCVLLSYRTPAAHVRQFVPPPLELVTRGPWAFWNVVACRVERMRPRGAPRWAGVSYHHVAYRLLVRAPGAGPNGRDLEGLYFVRSDADHSLIAAGGNATSDFRFHRADIDLRDETLIGGDLELHVIGRRDTLGDVALRVMPLEDGGAGPLAPGSPFRSIEQAAAFLKYRPLGIAVDPLRERLHLAEVFRDERAWRERPLRVIEARWRFLEELDQTDLTLERATLVAPIDYRWRLGRRIKVAPLIRAGDLPTASPARLAVAGPRHP
jgi:hypothetical protein